MAQSRAWFTEEFQMLFNKITITIVGLGLALAPFLPGHAQAAEATARTTSVFQQENGIACRIVTTTGRDRAVQCHIGGVWQSRPACAGDQLIVEREAARRAEHRPVIRLIPKTNPAVAPQVAPARPAATVAGSDETMSIALAAQAAADDVRRAVRGDRPTVAMAFAGFGQ